MSHRATVFFFSLVSVVGCAGVLDLEPVDYRAAVDAGDASDVAIDAQTNEDAANANDATPGDAAADARRSTGDATCDVQDDRLLHCTNRADAPLRAQPNAAAPVVNVLHTTSSYFSCWGIGEPHAGGNSTWYYALGDETATYGWLPAVMLNTPDELDADPSAFGLAKCP